MKTLQFISAINYNVNNMCLKDLPWGLFCFLPTLMTIIDIWILIDVFYLPMNTLLSSDKNKEDKLALTDVRGSQINKLKMNKWKTEWFSRTFLQFFYQTYQLHKHNNTTYNTLYASLLHKFGITNKYLRSTQKKSCTWFHGSM